MQTNNKIQKIEKTWLSYEDICELYGKVDRKNLTNYRKKRMVTFSKHPLNEKVYIYSKESIDRLLKRNLVEAVLPEYESENIKL